MSRVALKRRRAPEKSGSETGYPGFIEPCHPTLRPQAPAGRGWLHEIKHDGYRAQVHVHADGLHIYSRNALDWTKELSAIARLVGNLPVKEMILDGEAVVLSRKGVADLQALRRELGNPDSERLTYYAFDLLYLDGEDLRDAPLIERKTRLEAILRNAPPQLAYAEHLVAEGPKVYQNACELGLEGVVE